MIRSARGVELTAAGRVFLGHARLALAQVEAAGEAARRAAQPAKPSFALGFLTGHEIDWLPEAIRLLRDELPNIEITISSQYSPDLAGALVRRSEEHTSELQSLAYLVCRLLLEKKKKNSQKYSMKFRHLLILHYSRI